MIKVRGRKIKARGVRYTTRRIINWFKSRAKLFNKEKSTMWLHVPIGCYKLIRNRRFGVSCDSRFDDWLAVRAAQFWASAYLCGGASCRCRQQNKWHSVPLNERYKVCRPGLASRRQSSRAAKQLSTARAARTSSCTVQSAAAALRRLGTRSACLTDPVAGDVVEVVVISRCSFWQGIHLYLDPITMMNDTSVIKRSRWVVCAQS